MIVSQVDRSKLCVIQACSLPCRNHGAGHGLGRAGCRVRCILKTASLRETGKGVRIEEVLAEHTVLISLCSMTLS